MSNKPFKKLDARLLRVCDVVRTKLGLDAIHCIYQQGDRKDARADTLIVWEGWVCIIQFHPSFFKIDLQSQLHTIVHEHLHAMMLPMEQAVLTVEHNYVAKQDRKFVSRHLSTAREITVDHASLPLLRLLEPHIKKVL